MAEGIHSDAPFFRPLPTLWFGIGSSPSGGHAGADEVDGNSEF